MGFGSLLGSIGRGFGSLVGLGGDDPRRGQPMGPMPNPGMHRQPQPGFNQQPGFNPNALTSGNVEDPFWNPDRDQPWHKKWGDYLTGDMAQAVGGALGGVGGYLEERKGNELTKRELQLARERYEREAAFQEQKYADEREDRRGRHTREGPLQGGKINWRQY